MRPGGDRRSVQWTSDHIGTVARGRVAQTSKPSEASGPPVQSFDMHPTGIHEERQRFQSALLYIFRSGVATKARLISDTFWVPQLPIASFNSPCRISSTRSTPGWPNAPNPHK